MGQWNKIRNGFLPEQPEAKPTGELELAGNELVRRMKKMSQVGGGVEVTPEIIEGAPGLRIKIGFE